MIYSRCNLKLRKSKFRLVEVYTIEQYTPAEYYKNQKRHKDADGLGDYISRFFTRPLKNLMFSTSDRDSEYYVKDEEDLTDDE